MEDYLPILRKLENEGVEFALIGTWALKVYFPEAMAGYEIRDCDMVLQPGEDNIRRAAEVAMANGWEVEAWGEQLTPIFLPQALAGRFYIRARKGSLLLDMTFECPIPWPAMAAAIQWRLGLPIASVAHIVDLKRRKAREHGQVAETEAFLQSLLLPGQH